MKYTITSSLLAMAFTGFSLTTEAQAQEENILKTASCKKLSNKKFKQAFTLYLANKANDPAAVGRIVREFIKACPEKANTIFTIAIKVAPNAHHRIIDAYNQEAPRTNNNSSRFANINIDEFKNLNDSEFQEAFTAYLANNSSDQASAANIVKSFILAYPQKSELIFTTALVQAPGGHFQIIAAYNESAGNGNEVASAQGGSILSFPVGERSRFIDSNSTFYSDGTVVEEGTTRSLEETTFNSDGTVARLGTGGGGDNVTYFSDGTVAKEGTARFNESTTFNSDGTVARLGTGLTDTTANFTRTANTSTTFFSDGTVAKEGTARFNESTIFNSDGTIAKLGTDAASTSATTSSPSSTATFDSNGIFAGEGVTPFSSTSGANTIFFSDGTVASPGTARFNESTTFNSDGTVANIGTGSANTTATFTSPSPTATFDSNGIFAGNEVTEFTAIPGAGIVAGTGDGSSASLSSPTGGPGAFPITGGAPILPSNDAGSETPTGQNPVTTP